MNDTKHPEVVQPEVLTEHDTDDLHSRYIDQAMDLDEWVRWAMIVARSLDWPEPEAPYEIDTGALQKFIEQRIANLQAAQAVSTNNDGTARIESAAAVTAALMDAKLHFLASYDEDCPGSWRWILDFACEDGGHHEVSVFISELFGDVVARSSTKQYIFDGDATSTRVTDSIFVQRSASGVDHVVVGFLRSDELSQLRDFFYDVLNAARGEKRSPA